MTTTARTPAPTPAVPTSMRPYLRAVGVGPKSNHDISREEARDAMAQILDGRATRAQAAVFLIGMRVKGESPDELVGMLEAIRASAITIAPRVSGLVDVGSPYDGRTGTWVLSPAASILAAAAGAPIVMHGDLDIGPKRGLTVTEVLDAMGVDVDAPPDAVTSSIEDLNFGFIRASRFVPALYELRELREEICLRSAINTIEKMYNLANADYHLIGLSHMPYVKRFAGAFGLLGVKRTVLVQGIEGNEDANSWRQTRLIDVRYGETAQRTIAAAKLGLTRAGRDDVKMAPDAPAQAERCLAALSGDSSAIDRDLVVLNAAIRIELAGRADTLERAIAVARETLDSGAARRTLAALRDRRR